MRRIPEWFVRAKHWQIFLLLIGPGVAFLPLSILFAVFFQPRSQQDALRAIMRAYVVASIISGGTVIGWLWSLGSFLNSSTRRDLSKDPRLFKVSIWSMCLAFVLGELAALTVAGSNAGPSTTGNALTAIILPVVAWLIFSVFYVFYFVARALVTCERQEELPFGEYAQWFFLTWLSAIGVWFIQPKVNVLYASKGPTGEAQHPEDSPPS